MEAKELNAPPACYGTGSLGGSRMLSRLMADRNPALLVAK